MTDYISRKALLERLEVYEDRAIRVSIIANLINSMPSVDHSEDKLDMVKPQRDEASTSNGDKYASGEMKIVSEYMLDGDGNPFKVGERIVTPSHPKRDELRELIDEWWRARTEIDLLEALLLIAARLDDDCKLIYELTSIFQHLDKRVRELESQKDNS